MNAKRLAGFVMVSAAILVLAVAAQAAAADDSYIKWQGAKHTVSARLHAWPLYQVLARLATSTGWEVYVEPNLDEVITVEFANLTTSDALSRLLGQLNYALVPLEKGGAKLYVFRGSARQATEKVQVAAVADAKMIKGKLPGELVVVLKPGGKEKIEDIAKRLGAKIIGRIDGLNAYRLQFVDEAAAEVARASLASDSDVASVEYNYGMSRPSPMQSLANGSAASLNLKANPNPDPNRLVIGLVDTAVQAQASGVKDYLLNPISVAEGTATSATDSPSHGTAMAETILRGISLSTTANEGTTTRILPVDVYGGGESTSTFAVAQGIYAAVNYGATIVNLSLGGEGESTLLRQVIQQGHEQGVVFIAAAGNEPVTTATYPAAYAEVIATTASDKQGNLAGYANRGNFVDVMAPGGSVIRFNNLSYYVVGTSAAAAYVSGMTAGIAASNGKTPAQTESIIRSSQSYKSTGNP